MNFHSYITFLIKQFNKRPRVHTNVNELETMSHKWFGILPFMWKWLMIDIKK